MKADNKISSEEMLKAIKRSGYLIEQRVASFFDKEGYHVVINDTYKDFETGKTREIDLSAEQAYGFSKNDKPYYIFNNLIIECENNKQPLVLFRRKDNSSEFLFRDNHKIAGMPLEFYKNAKETENPRSFFSLRGYHYYYNTPISTQYCTFIKPKNKEKDWLALHADNQHATYLNLAKAIKFKMEVFAKRYYERDFVGDFLNEMRIKFYYPIIVLQGELYEAFIENGELKIEKKSHLQLQHTQISTDKPETYQIDIITEDFLPEFKDLVDRQTKSMVRTLEKTPINLIEKSIKSINKKLSKTTDFNDYISILTRIKSD